ncbi:DUF5317 domain-containing protein [Candidatus Bipolaricaulota bacterium]|nr:DUF5317 domain-containing protein [Candidatus Bipolaricaulota bacterium]
MFFLYVIPVGLLIGLLARGKIANLGKLPLRWVGLLFPALLIQLLIFPVFTSDALIPFATAPLHILSYALLAVWILANCRLLPIVTLGLGAVCNFAVLAANGGFMPASANALQQAGLSNLAGTLTREGAYSNLALMSADTRLNLLGDLLYVPKWIPLSAAFSIGDLLIALALVWLIVKGMRINEKRPIEAA